VDRNRLSLALGVIGATVALSGCPSSTTPSDVPIEMLGATYGSVSCNVIRDCYGASIVALFTGTSGIDACEARAEAAYVNAALPRYQSAIEMGTLSYDGSQAGACVDALNALGCAAVNSRAPAACDALFIGHVAPGGACALDEECEGAAYCNIAGACPGTCQPFVAAGGACTGDQACASGLRCSGGTCMVPAGDGASCQGMTGADCAGGLICQGGSAMRAGTCHTVDAVFAAASGAACNPTMGPLCQEGLSCIIESATSQTCGAGGLAAGAACHLSLPDQCATGFYCDGPSLMTMPPRFDGTCTALPTAGMPCASVVAGPACSDGNVCDSGMCVRIQENGGTCTMDMDCYGGQCRSGTCAVPTYCPTP
jgi:hypothetical protein